ncbi:dipeptidyl peptidase 4-like isoform X2 [Dendronephthya gigantea]|nr:dipeptidyl peptidase 4-like isoform X2 [Dendronephthya gigantea]
MFGREFYADIPDETWISDDTVLRVKNGDVNQYNFATNKTSVLFSQKTLANVGIYMYERSSYNTLSPDGQWMLFAVDVTQKYRYSTVSKFVAVNKETKKGVNISTDGPGSMSSIQYISWGNKGNSLVFVSDNDVYWIKSIEQPNAVRITSNGKKKIMFNGIPDWVYEEEILGVRPALVVSPDDKYLCFASFDDTDVPLFKIAYYGKPITPYTRIQDIAYPKPGTKNPIVHIYIYDVQKKKNIKLTPPTDMKDRDHYFTNLVWANSGKISIQWMNREQTTSVVMNCEASSGVCTENYRLDVENGWVDQNYPDPQFSTDGDFYVQLLPRDEGGDAGKFLHIAKVPFTDNAKVEFLTQGRWEVKRIASFDKKNEIVYYEGTEESSMKLHLYSVDLKGKKTCLSCELKETKEGRCTNYDSSFSTKSSWYILTCLGPGVPISWFKSSTDKSEILLYANTRLEKLLDTTEMPTYKYYVIKTTDEEYEIHVRELRPPNFDEKKKYAVLFNVYGGPSSKEIMETFQTGYHTYLTSNFDIIVCEVDGRGTAFRGRKFEHAVYKQLGEYEKNDTLAAARFMQSKDYVDPYKISIWGWSYGGFLTSYILSTQDSRVFQSGVAVAPVTDWRYYDSIYTERYMGMPDKSDNYIGYEFTSVLEHAKNIPDNSFLLVHGTGDDNVHFQNSAQLVEVMAEAGVKFEMQIYTDKHHSLEGNHVHRHLYHLLTDFFKDKLKL